jgi:hypothetical protein
VSEWVGGVHRGGVGGLCEGDKHTSIGARDNVICSAVQARQKATRPQLPCSSMVLSPLPPTTPWLPRPPTTHTP